MKKVILVLLIIFVAYSFCQEFDDERDLDEDTDERRERNQKSNKKQNKDDEIESRDDRKRNRDEENVDFGKSCCKKKRHGCKIKKRKFKNKRHWRYCKSKKPVKYMVYCSGKCPHCVPRKTKTVCVYRRVKRNKGDHKKKKIIIIRRHITVPVKCKCRRNGY